AYAAGNPNVAGRGAVYGLPGIAVDGNDLRAIHAAAAEAVQRARAGHGPTLIECLTYRTRPHAEGMGDYTYRSREEVEQWRARGPLQRLRSELLAVGIREPDLAAVEAEVESEGAQGWSSAESGPWPEPAEAATHVVDDRPHPVPAPAASAGF